MCAARERRGNSDNSREQRAADSFVLMFMIPPRCGLAALASRPLCLTFAQRFGWTPNSTGVRSCWAKHLGLVAVCSCQRIVPRESERARLEVASVDAAWMTATLIHRLLSVFRRTRAAHPPGNASR